MERECRTAGILTLASGAVAIIFGLAVVLMAGGVAGGFQSVPALPELPVRLPLIGGLGLPLAALGVIALAGGILSLRSRGWTVGLVGALFAVVCCAPLGIPALVLMLRCRGR